MVLTRFGWPCKPVGMTQGVAAPHMGDAHLGRWAVEINAEQKLLSLGSVVIEFSSFGTSVKSQRSLRSYRIRALEDPVLPCA